MREIKPVTSIRGVGEALEKHLARIGIHTLSDLLEHFPRCYEDRSKQRTIAEISHGDFALFEATVIRSELQSIRGKSMAKVYVRDDTGTAELVWFNQPYRARAWKPGATVSVYGRAGVFRNKLQIENPEVEIRSDAESFNSSRIVPVYPLTEGLGARTLRKIMAQALEFPAAKEETIPAEILQKYRLMDRSTALHEIHFPSDWSAMRQAKRRIVFEELFLLQCALAFLRKSRISDRRSIPHGPDGSKIQQLRQSLPFDLTSDQQTVYEEIRRDMESAQPMHRLLQGDVGSGKTAVALMALVKTVENGLQGALMVPTEILADQHFQSCTALLSGLDIRVALLTGRVKGSDRKKILHELQEGILDIVIGTHALLQPDVVFKQPGIVIVDEQHRFGVGQRASLQAKGTVPHTLVMSATPIPRTMALTLYGDMDVSVIHQLPPGRKPIVTAIRSGARDREKVYRFLIAEAEAGRQGYVVCPLVDDSEKLDAQSAIAVYEELTATQLNGVSCGLLHGRMSSLEKESVMSDFVAGKISVLVATTVIEVGINNPRATMMIVEDADRFGLAQLHQLRGRVGRGADRSYCVLLHKGGRVPERLQVLAETGDGFVVAEKDLLLRGPGQFLGYRQHGLPEMKMASLADDAEILEEARLAGLRTMSEPQGEAAMKDFLQDRFQRFFGVLFAG